MNFNKSRKIDQIDENCGIEDTYKIDNIDKIDGKDLPSTKRDKIGVINAIDEVS